jgi:hypothetical protein
MKKFQLKIFTALVALLLVAVLAAPAPAAVNWVQKNLRFSGTAGETLVTGDVVAILPSTGAIWKADADSATLRPAVGVIGKGGATGTTVEVVVSGRISGMTAASPGARIFLDTTAGGIVTTAPTNAQALGWVMPGAANAATSTTYFIHISIPSSGGAAY